MNGGARDTIFERKPLQAVSLTFPFGGIQVQF